ncbi:ion channel activity protein [Rhizophlyctis rosea]|nr:ion channel activity protein [Rhizophlyctis rosea]
MNSVRYIMYLIVTPLTYFQLQVLATCDFYSTAFYTYCSMAVITCRLVGALDNMNYRWGWFILSWLWFIPVVHQLAGTGRRAAQQLVQGGYVHAKLYGPLASVFICGWTMYGIIWGFAEGGNTIPLSAEIAWYAGTDLAAIVFYQMLMVWTMRKVDRVARGQINLRSNENMNQIPAQTV